MILFKTPETKIQASIIKALRARGFFVWKISDRFTSGVPDLLVIKNGKHTFLEIKTETGKTTKLQDYIIAEINKHGGRAVVVRSVAETLGEVMET